MKKRRWLKTLIAGVFLTLVLAIPLGFMVGTTAPTLSFEGVKINIFEQDGSAQVLFTVGVSNVKDSYGARFMLDYNPEYLIPSNRETNAPIATQGEVSTDAFFAVSPALYQEDGIPKNPFDEKADNNYVNISAHEMSLVLYTKQAGLKPGGSLYEVNIGEDGELRYVFDATGKTVAIGTVSFRVTDLSKLPEIVKKFDGITNNSNPVVGSDYLIRFSKATTIWTKGPWAIGACVNGGGGGAALMATELDDKAPPFISPMPATKEFTFNFPPTIVSVEAAEANLSLDAYRGYTNGNIGDVALALQKYSPSVIATYADGSQSTFLLPWGRKETPEDKSQYKVTGTYAATGGSYDVQQYFWYQDGIAKVKFPVPVEAHVAVTPITLQAVTADNLHKTYALENALVEPDGVGAVQTAAQFKLPSQARLVTDIPAGGASLVMTIPGWSPTEQGSKWPGVGEKISTLLADGSTAAGADIHWPTAEDKENWVAVSAQRKGTYSFTMAATYGGAAVKYTKADIQAGYPWLTVPAPEYPLPAATRKLVGETEQIARSRYEVTYVSTATNANTHPELALQVRRNQQGNDTAEDMNTTSVFRVLLPDGTELGTGLTTTAGAVSDAVTVDNWFGDAAANKSGYMAKQVTVGTFNDKRGYQLITTPGDTTSASAGSNAADRERLRRHINLGGWFAVSVNEDPATLAWSDFIPVYVPPRTNLHTESREYNFLGMNAGLFNWPGGLGTTVALPQGSYRPVDAAGNPLYEGDNITRKTERYGVATTYDGATGAEPGELNAFAVDSWDTAANAPVTTYGPNAFKDGGYYGAYGAVENPAPGAKTATIRKEGDMPLAATEGITLTYAGTSGVSTDADHNVTLVTYETRTQGYTVRQDYTLIITNVGSSDIYGLDVNTDADGGHFVLLKPPASFLPAGSSTTFTLSYVYDLKAAGGQALNYKDTIFITSNSHNDLGTNDYLRSFEAQFQVSSQDIHRVLVKFEPADGCMGTAQAIVGEVQNPAAVPPDPAYTMNTTAGTTAFHKDDKVYIMAATTDEYTVDTVTCVDGAGNVIVLQEYTGGDGSASGRAELPDRTEVHTFTMPDYDATVTVKFKEPVSSKLRLSELTTYAEKTEAELKPTVLTPTEYMVWQKTFSADQQAAAAAWVEGGKGTLGEYLMTCGTANKEGLTVDPAEHNVEQYLVVIPFDAEYAQVQAKLRQVAYTLSGANPDITPTVSMFLYDTSPVAGAVTPSSIMDPPQTGNTATPTIHFSKAFPSPKPGASKFVRVDIEYKETSTTTTIHSYYLEIHRKPENVVATLGYGNSPYGMIMNDPAIDGTIKDTNGKTAKDRAKAAFVANGYSFGGLTAGVPQAVKDGGLAATRYWTEAWVDVNGVYDPESGIGVDTLYDSTKNLDLSDTAFFATWRQDFLDPGLISATDSSGRPADSGKAVISLEAITLDAAQTAQSLRFRGPDPTDLDAVAARTAKLELGKAGELVDKSKCGALDLRPGLYVLTYTFPDYDGVGTLSVTRPFVLAAPVGDVNADGLVEKGAGKDEGVLKSRVTAPLGYTAEEYPYAAIFKFRSCDANNDRNINNIDANTIREGAGAPNRLSKFYLPTGYKPAPAPTP